MNHIKEEKTPALFLMGLALGTLLTMLITPKNGEEIRNNIKDRVKSMKNNSTEKTDDLNARLEEKIKDVNDLVQEQKNRVNQNE